MFCKPKTLFNVNSEMVVQCPGQNHAVCLCLRHETEAHCSKEFMIIAGPAELSQTTSIEVRMPEALLMGHTISRSSSTLDNSHSPENLESSHTYRTLGDTQGASATMQSKVWLQEMPPNYGPGPRGMNQRSSSHETNVIQTCS